MSNPDIVYKTAYASENEARALWSNLLDNDKLEIQAIVIHMLADPQNLPVAWIITEKKAIESIP